jgi:hypothetical protein
MRGNGKQIGLMGGVGSFISVESGIKVFLLKAIEMEKVNIQIKMERYIKDCGKMVNL